MREHGVLRRVLLVYRESGRRLAANNELDAMTRPPSRAARRLIRRFVEDYHEKQEEDFLFPRFEKREDAHRAGGACCGPNIKRVARLTDRIQALATAPAMKDSAAAPTAHHRARRFRAHVRAPRGARGHRPLPGPHEITSRRVLRARRRLERREHQLFGGDGFAQAVAEIEGLGSASAWTISPRSDPPDERRTPNSTSPEPSTTSPPTTVGTGRLAATSAQPTRPATASRVATAAVRAPGSRRPRWRPRSR